MHGYIGFWAVTEYSSSDAPNSFSLLLSILYIPQTKLKSAQTYKVQWYCFFHYSILLDKWQMNLVTVTDFLIKLGIKPCMHLLEIGIFSLPYARHYNPRFVYFLPHFSVRFIIKSGFKSRAGYNGARTVVKKYLFPIDAYMVWCPTWSKNLGRYLLYVHWQWIKLPRRLKETPNGIMAANLLSQVRT